MAFLVVTAASCGGGAKDVFDDAPDATKLAVRLSEYKIETKGNPTDAVTKLVAQNTGTVTHDIKLVRTDLAADALPKTGADVDESKLDILAKKTDIKRRDRVELDVKLQPGSYVLFCNVSGHYQLGMHTGFKVAPK
jgi:uncharacterized cupredoxin-like copper-binding protein